MSRAAKSIFIFGIYVTILGLLITLIPNIILSIFSHPETQEIWIRVAGMLVFILGLYYVAAARAELTEFFRFTVYGRWAVMFFFLAFVIFLNASPVLIAIAFVDLCGAIWTRIALSGDI